MSDSTPRPWGDALWDALREQCCATKPPTDAKTVVMLRRGDLDAALSALEKGAAMEEQDE